MSAQISTLTSAARGASGAATMRARDPRPTMDVPIAPICVVFQPQRAGTEKRCASISEASRDMAALASGPASSRELTAFGQVSITRYAADISRRRRIIGDGYVYGLHRGGYR